MSDGLAALPEGAAADPLWDDWDAPPRVAMIPELHLDGFDGPLDLLLDLAERARIDLARLPVATVMDQLAAAIVRQARHIPLERQADWVVLAARLLQLRSALLLPSTKEAAAARREAGREVERLRRLAFVRAAAAWLEARPQLGRDVFARPSAGPDPRTASYMQLMEACLTLLEREEARFAAIECGAAPGAAEPVYRPVRHALFRLPDALARMRAAVARLEDSAPLLAFLPRLPSKDNGRDRELVVRSAVATTFLAALELTRTAEIRLDGGDRFEELLVRPPAGVPAA